MDINLPYISIILPVFNEERYLDICLKTLKQVDYPSEKFEVITVDNGSTDNSLHIAQQHTNKALVLKKGNVGAVRNLGVSHAKGDIIAFLDSDCLVDKQWLKKGVQLLNTHIKTAFGGNLYLREKPFWIEKFWLLHNPNHPLLQSDLLGSCIFIKKEDFTRIGGFNEKVSSGEDSEFAQTLRNNNYNVTIDGTIGVIHLGNPTTINAFIKRQIWHSENYGNQWRQSLKDKTVWLITAFITSALILPFSFVYAPLLLVPTSMSLLLIPLIFSIKRISRSKFRPQGIQDILKIYFIDVLYLLGRSTGLLKGIFKR